MDCINKKPMSEQRSKESEPAQTSKKPEPALMSKWTDITLEIIQNSLSEKRWRHTLGVTDAAIGLAGLWGGDVEKAVVASYCHDFAKELSEGQSDYYVRKYKLPEKFLHGSEIAHGHIAAAILADEYHMRDEDILNAIRYHSTGRPGMSQLEKIVYLADLIEDGRTYKGVEEIKRLASIDLDGACMLAFKEVMEFVIRQGKVPDADTREALEYLTNDGIS